PAVVHAAVRDGSLEAGAGALPGGGLVVETGPALKPLISGGLGPDGAGAPGGGRPVGGPRPRGAGGARFPLAHSPPPPLPRPGPAGARPREVTAAILRTPFRPRQFYNANALTSRRPAVTVQLHCKSRPAI